jgi:hypothetical protein
MNRRWPLAVCLIAGCSTHPLTDIADFFKPGRLHPDGQTAPYGGVCRNQGPIAGPGAGGPPQIDVGPPQPVTPAAPIIPPPVPITTGPPEPVPPIPPPLPPPRL